MTTAAHDDVAVLAARSEELSAEELVASAGRALRPTRLARLLLPEGGERPPRHALRRRPRRARLRDRHPLPLPGDVRALARGRAAVRHEDRGVRGPERRGASPRRTARSSGSASPTSTSRSPRSSRSSERSETSTAGSPASAANSRRRARTHRSSAGTSGTSSGRQTRSPTGPSEDCWTYIRERGLPYNALHDRGYASIGDIHSTLPGVGREGRWAHSDRTECGLHTT